MPTHSHGVLLLPALALVACAGVPDAPPATSGGSGALLQDDEALEITRALAGRETSASANPELDALMGLVASMTPELGLRNLLAEQPRERAATRLAAGDTISLAVFGQSEFNGEDVVAGDGTIRVALLGVVKAAGRTPSELAGELKTALESTYLRRAEVTVRLLKRPRRTVSLFGAVQAPGAFELPFARSLSLHGLLTQAKGLTPEADGERIGLIRDGEGGARRCYHISYGELLAARVQGRQAWLEPDDQVVVAQLPDVFVHGAVERPGRQSLRPGSTVASLLMSAGLLPGADVQEIWLMNAGTPARRAGRLDESVSPGTVVFVPHGLRVYVAGAVRSSGPVSLPRSQLTLLRVLGEAGWFTETANVDGTRILRSTEAGQMSIVVPVSELLSGERSEGEYPLLPGDLVTVPERRW